LGRAAVASLVLVLLLAVSSPLSAALAQQEGYQKVYEELSFTVLTPSYDPIRVRIGDLLGEWCKQIGIKVVNKPVDFSTLVDLVWDKFDFDMYIIGWGMCIMPWYYHRYCSWEYYPGGMNAEGFCNATFDALFNESKRTVDPAKRREIIFKMQEILAEQLPIVGLYMRDMVEAGRAEIAGWRLGVWGIHWFLTAQEAYFIDKPEGGGTFKAPLMDDMRSESIVNFGGTVWDDYPLSLIYEYLFIMNESYEPVPWLAERYEVSPDGKVYTIYLRQNVTWHDGVPFTAEDVKFTIEYYKKNHAPWWWEAVKDVERVEVVDRYTVRIFLKETDVWYLRKLAELLPIIPKHCWENIPWNTTKPPMIGTGPFMWVEHVPGEYVKLKKNPNYWRKGYPKFDEIIFPIITNPSAMLLALKKGEIHYMTWYVPPAAIREVAADPNLRLFATPAPSFYYLGFNLKRYPLSELPVRKAIAMVIDKEKIVKELLLGWGRPANWFCAPNYKYWWNPNATTPPHDPEAAKKLLDEAGFIDIDGDGIREVPLAFTPVITVSLNKKAFMFGETMVITGYLKTEKGEPLANRTVTIEIKDSLGRTLVSKAVTTGPDGSFKLEYVIPEGAPTGSYTIVVRAYGTTKTEVVNVGPLEYLLTVATDAAQYNPGDVVKITGSLVTAVKEPVAGETVEISISDPTGKVIFTATVKTASDGSFSYEYKIPEDAKEGLYRIMVKAKGVAETADFAVVIPPPPWYLGYAPWIAAIIVIVVVIAAVAYLRRARA